MRKPSMEVVVPMVEALNDDEEYVRRHACELLNGASEADCFYGWELCAVARGFIQESIENYAHLAGKQEAIKATRAFLERLEATE